MGKYATISPREIYEVIRQSRSFTSIKSKTPADHNRITNCANNGVSQEKTERTAVREGRGRTKEETSANDTTNTTERKCTP